MHDTILHGEEMEIKKARHNSKSCFFNDQIEEDYLYSFLREDMTVLEWGSGNSSKAIAARVKELHSIEHNQKWAGEVRPQLPENAFLHFVPHDIEEGAGEDGSYEEYKNYVDFPKRLGKKFDLILVDGRARVACCRAAVNLLKEGGVILLHDHRNPNKQFDRREYHVVDEFLKEIGHVYALYAFKPKK